MPPPAEPPKEPAPVKSEDVRLLAVDFDGQGERIKAWREAVNESTQEVFSDQPMDSPPSALTTCKNMQRVGGDLRLWLREYLREKGLSNTDRVAHEMRTLVESFWHAGTVDSLSSKHAAHSRVPRRVWKVRRVSQRAGRVEGR